MGAVVVKSGRVLGSASNERKNDPSIPGINRCSIHAETAVLRTTKARGSTVYVARLTRSGTPAMAKPCAACEAQLIDHGVRRVIWTIDESSYGITELQRFV